MFTKKSIVAFNNVPFSDLTIANMSPEPHKSYGRLVQAASELRNVSTPAAIARMLNISPQTLTNWAKRGVSETGALQAQKAIGCDANWLLGDEDTAMARPAIATSIHDRQAPHAVNPWPFKGFTASEFLTLIDADRRMRIEAEITGLITLAKQGDARLTKAG